MIEQTLEFFQGTEPVNDMSKYKKCITSLDVFSFGLILLRIVEIIGEDKLENLGSETLNFILIALNQLDLDKIRDKII